MAADDAADTIAELPQRRRQPVLDLMRPGQRAKVMTLMGFHQTSVHALGPDGRLLGVARLVTLLQSGQDGPLAGACDTDPVRIGPGTDIMDVAVLMTDYNLITIPVVDAGRRMLGLITVDDVSGRSRAAARPGRRSTAVPRTGRGSQEPRSRAGRRGTSPAARKGSWRRQAPSSTRRTWATSRARSAGSGPATRSSGTACGGGWSRSRRSSAPG
jgi:CBS domain-containing protein